MYSDKNLTCADCGQEFVFTASEQDFYAQRGFTEPRRCPSCRASRKAARNAERRRQLVRRLRRRRRVFRRRFRRRRWRRWRRLRLPRSRPARDVHGHLLELRPRGPGPVPPDQRQARLLQRLLPEHARRLTRSSRRGPTHGPPNQRDPRPGSSADRVVRFCGRRTGRSPGRPSRAMTRPVGRAPSRCGRARCLGSAPALRSTAGGRTSRPRTAATAVVSVARPPPGQQPEVELALRAVEEPVDVVGVGHPDQRRPDRRVEHVRQRRLGHDQQHEQHRREHRRRARAATRATRTASAG